MALESHMKPCLVVAFDPLCGWCFAFEPVLTKLRKNYATRFDFEIAMGGLVTGERVRPIAADADYLRRGLAMVEQRSGVKAGPAYFKRILEPGTWVSNSEPPARAIRLARELSGETAALDLAAAFTTALYVDGNAPDDPKVVEHLATKLGLPAQELLQRWHIPQEVHNSGLSFAREKSRGILSYPSAFLKQPGDQPLLQVLSEAVSLEEASRLLDQVEKAIAQAKTFA
jgi:putative protein-disulfide isomerase